MGNFETHWKMPANGHGRRYFGTTTVAQSTVVSSTHTPLAIPIKIGNSSKSGIRDTRFTSGSSFGHASVDCARVIAPIFYLFNSFTRSRRTLWSTAVTRFQAIKFSWAEGTSLGVIVPAQPSSKKIANFKFYRCLFFVHTLSLGNLIDPDRLINLYCDRINF